MTFGKSIQVERSEMELLNIMKEYCDNLFDSNEPESKAVYQALLPAVIRCEITRGDAIECATEDLVLEVTRFMRIKLEMVDLTREQLGSVVEGTVEFIIKAILTQVKKE